KGCPDRKYESLVITKEKIVIKDEIVHFYYDSAQIKPESLPILCEVAEFLRENPSICVRVEGHASSEGSLEYNFRLSDNRNLAIRDQLIACGIDAGRLTTQPYGESKPLVAPDDTEAKRELNRRVEFVITKGGE
ncbi:MAG: OmpA family protein, partial [Patescibacteria group bacterium]